MWLENGEFVRRTVVGYGLTTVETSVGRYWDEKERRAVAHAGEALCVAGGQNGASNHDQ